MRIGISLSLATVASKYDAFCILHKYLCVKGVNYIYSVEITFTLYQVNYLKQI